MTRLEEVRVSPRAELRRVLLPVGIESSCDCIALDDIDGSKTMTLGPKSGGPPEPPPPHAGVTVQLGGQSEGGVAPSVPVPASGDGTPDPESVWDCAPESGAPVPASRDEAEEGPPGDAEQAALTTMNAGTRCHRTRMDAARARHMPLSNNV